MCAKIIIKANKCWNNSTNNQYYHFELLLMYIFIAKQIILSLQKMSQQ